MANAKTPFTPTSLNEEAKLLTSVSSPPSPPTSSNHRDANKEIASSTAVRKAKNVASSQRASSLNQQYVDHTYTDYANVDEEDLRLMKDTTGSRGADSDKTKLDCGGTNVTKTLLGLSCSYGPMKSKGHGGSVMMPFPGKLLEVLDRGDLNTIIDWMPHGRAFIVKQPKVFTTQVLTRFFKQTKLLSFTRQLNLWGFKRISRGIDAGAYYHELFLPGRPNLAMRMKRQKIKGTGIRPIPNPEQEPNFYYDYPPVEKVPRSKLPIPLPLLPSERVANLMHHHGHHQGAAPNLLQHEHRKTSMPASTNGVLGRSVMNMNSIMGAEGLGLSGHQGRPGLNVSMAAAAEYRLLATMNPVQRLNTPHSSSFSTAGVSNVKKNGDCSTDATFPKLSSASSLQSTVGGSSGLDPRSLFLRQRMHAAPRSFHPLDEARQAHNELSSEISSEISSANRRLMERLMDQSMDAPAPPTPHGRSLFPPLYQDNPPRKSTVSQQTALRRGSFVSRACSSVAAAAPPNPNLSLLDSYLLRPHSLYTTTATPVPSSGRATASSQDVVTVTNALREAYHLEELIRSERVRAGALAGALQGCDVRHLMSLAGGHQDFSSDAAGCRDR
eukprot:CAMPEP_0196130040 /NCGR_PEP_ID=MMETSP0910-20130528/550_1 /TAXON_ID=49265 /ORGANISM="Thalassiosira rotula, Strain GSO102" /LENGTH=609 /DNA_ID=CAMNT_0041389265 /DNA_START=72 /DNA_END=1901 /DNA_ORIENTATION=-